MHFSEATHRTNAIDFTGYTYSDPKPTLFRYFNLSSVYHIRLTRCQIVLPPRLNGLTIQLDTM